MIDNVKIGGVRYTVREVDQLFESNRMGECHPTRSEILIRASMSHDQKRETLVHEVIEAINSDCDLDLSHSVISTLSHCLHQVLADNPGLFS